MKLDDPASNGKTEAGTAFVRRTSLVASVEAFEDELRLAGWNSRPVVDHLEPRAITVGRSTESHCATRRTSVRVAPRWSITRTASIR